MGPVAKGSKFFDSFKSTAHSNTNKQDGCIFF